MFSDFFPSQPSITLDVVYKNEYYASQCYKYYLPHARSQPSEQVNKLIPLLDPSFSLLATLILILCLKLLSLSRKGDMDKTKLRQRAVFTRNSLFDEVFNLPFLLLFTFILFVYLYLFLLYFIKFGFGLCKNFFISKSRSHFFQ